MGGRRDGKGSGFEDCYRDVGGSDRNRDRSHCNGCDGDEELWGTDNVEGFQDGKPRKEKSKTADAGGKDKKEKSKSAKKKEKKKAAEALLASTAAADASDFYSSPICSETYYMAHVALDHVADSSITLEPRLFDATFVATLNSNSTFLYDDSCSSCCVFNTPSLLSNVRKLPKPIPINGVATATIEERGDHPLFGEVYLLRSLPINIVPNGIWNRKLGYSMSLSADGSGKDLILTKPGAKTIVFSEHWDGVRNFRRAHKDMFELTSIQEALPAAITPIPLTPMIEALPAAILPRTVLPNAAYFTPEQRARAAEAKHLHETLCHPSDEVLKATVRSPSLTNCGLSADDVDNMRAIYGACGACTAGKPISFRGRNSLHESMGIVNAGQCMHCDLVYFKTNVYLFAVDEVSGYDFCPRIASKNPTDIMTGFKHILTELRAANKVLRQAHTDAERVFDSLKEPLAEQGVKLIKHVPGEHEATAERNFRTMRERVRTKLAEIAAMDVSHPASLIDYLIKYVTTQRNNVPNEKSGDLIPHELIYGTRVNYLTDFRVDYFTLIVCRSTSAKRADPTGAVQEICLCLGAVGNATPRAYYALSKETGQVTQRHVLKTMVWTPDWRAYLEELTNTKGCINLDVFKFGDPTRTLTDTHAGDSVPPVVHSGATTTASPPQPDWTDLPRLIGDNKLPAEQATSPKKPAEAPSVHKPPTSIENAVVPAAAAIPKPSVEPITVAEPAVASVSKHVKIAPTEPELRRSTRERKPNSLLRGTTGEITLAEAFVDMCLEREITEPTLLGDPFSAIHTVLVTSIDAAMKTPNKVAAEAAMGKELSNLVKANTWRYLKRVEDRQPSVHTNVEPSAAFIKDKLDSRGKLLLLKARFYNVGSHTTDANYGPYEKTSPTASHNTLLLLLALASFKNWKLETFDTPHAYVNASLPDGKRHVMRISKLIADILCKVDPSAGAFRQANGTLLVELLKALYGLPEAGKLWHKFLCEVLRRGGYEPMPGDTCLWKRVVKSGTRTDIGIIAVIVDDCLFAYSKASIRDELYAVFTASGIPNLTVQALGVGSPISFCGLSIERDVDGAIFTRQPGFLLGLVAEHGNNEPIRPNPLPANYSNRVLTEEQKAPLPGGSTAFLKVINSIAWMTRSRTDIMAAVAYLQRRQNAPRVVDLDDARHIIGYLRGTSNIASRFKCNSPEPILYTDGSFAPHSDCKSHGGCLIILGEGGPVIDAKSFLLQTMATSSTECELMTTAQAADALLVVEQKMRFMEHSPTLPMEIRVDNTSSITMQYMGRPSLHARRRFIDIKYFWIHQFLERKQLAMKYVPGTEQLADCLASIRSGADFKAFARRVCGAAPLASAK